MYELAEDHFILDIAVDFAKDGSAQENFLLLPGRLHATFP